MPNTTQLILTFYLEFAPIKILKSENLQEEEDKQNPFYMSFHLDPVTSL